MPEILAPDLPVDLLEAQGTLEVAKNNEAAAIRTRAMGSSDTHFNGTLGDLKLKFPEVYDKLIIQSIGYQICQQCKNSNERFLEEMKRQRKD